MKGTQERTRGKAHLVLACKITNQYTSYERSSHNLVKTVDKTKSVFVKSSFFSKADLSINQKSSLLPEPQVQMIGLSSRLVSNLIVGIDRGARDSLSFAFDSSVSNRNHVEGEKEERRTHSSPYP
jgi:hypothetical protein